LLAETAVFRFKIIFGTTLSTRTLSRQITEARIKGVFRFIISGTFRDAKIMETSIAH